MKTWILRHTPTLVGVMFLWAGFYKLLYPGQATMSLETLNVPYAVAKALITATIIAELYLGVILVRRLDLRFGLSMAMGLMFLFTGYLWHLSTLADPNGVRLALL